jgi:hypothetical protein
VGEALGGTEHRSVHSARRSGTGPLSLAR